MTHLCSAYKKPIFLDIWKNYLFLIGGYLLYNIVLISAMHQHESAIGIHISPPSWTSLSPPTTSHTLGGHRRMVWVPVSYRKFPLAISKCLYFHATFSIHPILSSPTVSASAVLFLHLHCCHANRFMRAIFLDSIYLC